MIAPWVMSRGTPDEQFFEAFFMGLVTSQFALAGIWLPLSSNSIVIRTVGTIAIGLIWYGCWAVGMLHNHELDIGPRYLIAVLLNLFLTLPLICLAVQFPFWLLRICFQWRLQEPTALQPSGREPISIKDLMVATLVVAVALGLVGFASSGQDSAGQTLQMLFGSLIIAVGSFLIVTPAIVAIFRSRSARLAIALLVVEISLIAATGAGAALAFGDPLPTQLFFLLLLLGAGFMVGFAVPLGAARWIGYRLELRAVKPRIIATDEFDPR